MTGESLGTARLTSSVVGSDMVAARMAVPERVQVHQVPLGTSRSIASGTGREQGHLGSQREGPVFVDGLLQRAS